jgi:hypothetical protein
VVVITGGLLGVGGGSVVVGIGVTVTVDGGGCCSLLRGTQV